MSKMVTIQLPLNESDAFHAHQYLTHQNVWYLSCSVKHNIGLFIKGETSFIEIKAEQNKTKVL